MSPPSTTMYFLSGSAILNYAPGFTDGFSFFYTPLNFEGVVRVYAGEDASGALLGELVLIVNSEPGRCIADPSGAFCNCDGVSGVQRTRGLRAIWISGIRRSATRSPPSPGV